MSQGKPLKLVTRAPQRFKLLEMPSPKVDATRVGFKVEFEGKHKIMEVPIFLMGSLLKCQVGQDILVDTRNDLPVIVPYEPRN